MPWRETMESVSVGHEKDLVEASLADVVKCGEEAQIQASAELLDNLRKMVNEPAFSDVVFVCQDGIRVHALRKFLAGRSDVFNKLLTNGMKESNLSEIELTDISSHALLYVLEFLYTGTLLKNSLLLWWDACYVLIASRFFLLPNLEKIVRKLMHTSLGGPELQNVASLLVAVIELHAWSDEADVKLKELITGLRSTLCKFHCLRILSEEDFHFVVRNMKGRLDLVYVRRLSRDALNVLKEFSYRDPEKLDLNSFKQLMRWCQYASDHEVKTRKIEVSVKTLFGKTITLTVKSSYTIDKVKRKIEERVGSPPDEQQLSNSIFPELKDEHTLAHYDILDGSTLTVHFLKRLLQIFVIVVGAKITVEVQGSTTIAAVKKNIEDSLACPVYDQHLYFGGKQLNDGHTLADYNIKMFSTLRLGSRLKRSLADFQGGSDRRSGADDHPP